MNNSVGGELTFETLVCFVFHKIHILYFIYQELISELFLWKSEDLSITQT